MTASDSSAEGAAAVPVAVDVAQPSPAVRCGGMNMQYAQIEGR